MLFNRYNKCFISLAVELSFALMSLLTACVDEYVPQGVEQLRGLLVVDGIISDGFTSIKLSRSVGLTDVFDGDEFVNNAKVQVEGEDGSVYPCYLYNDRGEYLVDMGKLDMDNRYRLRILLDGDEYESAYMQPVSTPQIDSISLRKDDKAGDIHLCVSTHNSPDESKYYRWIYKENWEVKAEIFMAAEWIGDRVVTYDLQTANNYYYCWGKDSSKVMSLASSDKLADNVISNKSIVSYPSHDRRFSILYHVEVTQYALHREAYDYYFNLQKNIEESGGLFAPIPSEMRGNIRCVSDPDTHVIGFVEVSCATNMKRFMPEIKDYYTPEQTGCASTIVQGWEYEKNPDYGYVSYNPTNMESNVYALRRCMNCELYGSKNKPSWWPTSHL